MRPRQCAPPLRCYATVQLVLASRKASSHIAKYIKMKPSTQSRCIYLWQACPQGRQSKGDGDPHRLGLYRTGAGYTRNDSKEKDRAQEKCGAATGRGGEQTRVRCKLGKEGPGETVHRAVRRRKFKTTKGSRAHKDGGTTAADERTGKSASTTRGRREESAV